MDLETDEIEEYNVNVLDAFYKDGSAYILIQDVATDIKRIISIFFRAFYSIIIRYFAKKLSVSARDIERTLFYVHHNYQKGNLYDNLTNIK